MGEIETTVLSEGARVPFQIKFPVEIQDMIWASTIDLVGPRVVHIKSLRNHKNQILAAQSFNLDSCGNGLCTPKGSIPLALQICHRSRELALRQWSTCLRIPRHDPFTNIFFDRENDFVYDGMPGLTSPLCILPHARNVTVQVPHGYSHKPVNFSREYQLAKQIHNSLYNIKIILLIVPHIENYLSGAAAQDEVLEFPKNSAAGWLYSDICSWYRVQGRVLPEIQFTGLEQLGERFYKRCILISEGSTV